MRLPPLHALLLACLAACGKKAVGDPCAVDTVACLDEHTGLFCSKGHLATMSCLGASGCESVARAGVACDNGVATLGDGCNQVKDVACSRDRTMSLVCASDKFVLAEPCKGPRGCTASAETIYCDNALAEPGDPCTEEGDTACRIDRGAFLKCRGGKFVMTNACRGPRRCTVIEKPEENKEHFECDDSVTEPGDPCEDEGAWSCGRDLRSQNACRSHAIVLAQACPAGSACAYQPAQKRFACDAPKKK